MVESERSPLVTSTDEASWLKRVAEINVRHERLLNLHLDGDITKEQFRVKSTELEDARAAAEDQLEAARSRLIRIKDIERSKEALISHYASLVPQGLAELSAGEKNQIYKMMRLHVFADGEGALTAEWGCNALARLPGSFKVTTPVFKFSALLTDGGAERLELMRA